ncbi:MAG: tRNA pseudouridine(38-40) synthase TruA [Pseudomonadota bacterium]
MPRYKLTIEYHGGPFVGWQRQESGRSVQGQIEAALRRLEPRAGSVQGAGRTDAGVHATAQVAHCDMAKDWDPFRLREALNHHLKPDPIAICAAERVADDFHARFDATRRDYLYRLICRRAPLTIEKGLAWRQNEQLDAAAMGEAARMLTGRHDFTTFRSAHCQAASPVKTLDRFEIRAEGPEIRCFLSARSFLHNQVRSFVGTLVQVGLGRWPASRVRDALEAADRAACGPVAPPDGLYLTAVDYPKRDA